MGKYAHYTEMPDSDMKDELTASTALEVLESDEEEIPILARLRSHVPLRINRNDTPPGVVGHARGRLLSQTQPAAQQKWPLPSTKSGIVKNSVRWPCSSRPTLRRPAFPCKRTSAGLPQSLRLSDGSRTAWQPMCPSVPVDLAPMGSAAMGSRLAPAVSSAVSNGRSHPL